MISLRLLMAKLRAACWALRATRTARRRLATGGLDALALPPVPPLPHGAAAGVELVLRLGVRNCLVRSAVRQAWYAAYGREYDLVIGVTTPSRGFKAHAWLEVDPPEASEGFEELLRRPAAGRGADAVRGRVDRGLGRQPRPPAA